MTTERLDCPVPWCQTAICSAPAKYLIAAREEVPAGCANSAAAREVSSRLRRIVFGAEAAFTPDARRVLALRPGGGGPRQVLEQLEEGRLVFLEPRTPRPLRSAPPIRKRPAPAAPSVLARGEEKLAWIKLRVVDDATGDPRPGVVLHVTQPNGRTFEFTTRPDGVVEVDGIDPGVCSVTCGLDGARRADTYGFVTLGEVPSTLQNRGDTAASPSGGDAAVGATAESNGHQNRTAPSPRGIRVAVVEEHKVRTGESIKSLADANGLTWQQLAIFNWGTAIPDEINVKLRDEVGCTKKAPDGVNYRFDDGDEPGIVLLPTRWSAAGLATERTHTIRVRTLSGGAATIAHIRLHVFDEDEQPISNAECTIKDLSGAEIFAGRSDGDGRIRKDDVPFDDFRLEIEGYERIIPSVAYDDEWIDVFIPPRGYIRMLVHGPSQEALAGAAFSVADLQGGLLFEGTTDAQGKVKRDRVKLDDYRLTVGEFERIIPAVAFDDEWIDVFTEAAKAGGTPETTAPDAPATDAASAGG